MNAHKTCHAHNEILDAFEQCHKEGITEGWKEQGWGIDEVFDCCLRYELETGEKMSFGEIEEAIYRSSESICVAPVRQEYYFLGYIQNNQNSA